MTVLPTRLLLLVFALSGIAACGSGSDEPSAADRALQELEEKYEELRQADFGNPKEWAEEDIENIGDWEYRVVEIEMTTPEAFEDELNALGNDRWEVFWVERTTDGYLVMLKKPSISWLSKIPLSQIGRFVVGGSEDAQ